MQCRGVYALAYGRKTLFFWAKTRYFRPGFRFFAYRNGIMNLPERFSTTLVNGRDRFSYWREAVCDAYVQLGCEAAQQHGFQGEIQLERLPNISISIVSGTAHEVHRRIRDIARSNDEFFLLSLQTRNNSLVTQGDRIAELQPGDCALYGSTDPYVLTLSDHFQQLVVQVPKQQLLSRLPNADLLTGRRISGASEIGNLVGKSLMGFCRTLGRGGGAVQSFGQDVIVDLIATGLATLEDANCELSLPEQHIVLRARSFIQANLGNLELDRNAVAAATGLSVRRLNEIFAKQGSSISGCIRETRLERAARDLSDPSCSWLSISEIAGKWGFGNFQHFSKVFRERFGTSPSVHRQRAGEQIH